MGLRDGVSVPDVVAGASHPVVPIGTLTDSSGKVTDRFGSVIAVDVICVAVGGAPSAAVVVGAGFGRTAVVDVSTSR